MNPIDVEAWRLADPDPLHRAELADWEVTQSPAAVISPLRFGTAGLRGPMGPGPGQMNRVVVRITARAIGRELVATGLAARGVVIGHDARPHSDEYATDSARMLRALGVPCTLIGGPVPTPVLAHRALSTGAAAGIMVTASHNPRGDNGYKVYWSDGAQIRSPIDEHIEARMDFADLPLDADLAGTDEIEVMAARAAIAEYLGATVTERVVGDAPRVVYTPLCGVGAETMDLAFAAAGLAPPRHVPEQRVPDGSFPGLPFPNPEEPGTLDLAIATAEANDIEVILANDPDADRLGVAVREADGWWQLTGDEIGTLLCDRRLRTTTGDQRIVASSVVSGGMVPALCAARGVRHITTLTGFKWIMRPAIDEVESTWVFGYEEALGFSVGDRVRDKDGITAAIEFMGLLAELQTRRVSLRSHLRALAEEVGGFATTQVSIRGEPRVLAAALQELRKTPPQEIAGTAVDVFEDWLERPADQRTNLLIFRLGDGGRIAVRPSGTEPKIKLYLEAYDPDPSSLDHALEARLGELSAAVRAWFD